MAHKQMSEKTEQTWKEFIKIIFTSPVLRYKEIFPGVKNAQKI